MCPGLAGPTVDQHAIQMVTVWNFLTTSSVATPPYWIIHKIYVRTVWRSVFRFSKLGHIGAQVSNSALAWTVNGVQALRFAEMGSCYLITSECLAVILVQHVITVFILAFGCTVHKHKVKISDILPAELHADRLLGSTKPGHVKLSDRSAAKRLPKHWWWLSSSRVFMLNFVWSNCVCKWVLLCHCMLN